MKRRALPTSRLPVAWLAGTGLTEADADARRRRHGRNDIVETPPGRARALLLETAKDPMLWFFAGTGALYFLTGQPVEAVVLFAAILPLIGMDVFLHRRTQASTEGLRTRLAATATVVRDGAPREVAAADVVPGDLVAVEPGDAFPADGVVVDGAGLQVDESALTGESYPVAKEPVAAPPEDGAEPLVAGEHWGLAGTRLLTGHARVRVVYTGRETLYGEIVRSAAAGAHGRTPLQGAIDGLVSVLLVVAAVLCLIVAFTRLRQGYGWVDALVSAVTLATAALPEEFPVVFTFFLGVGVYRLARRQALVRRAVSVENIGRVSCICSDKTGTLTEGALRVTGVFPAPGLSDTDVLALAALASRPEAGDPLDAAVVRAASAAGVAVDGREVLTIYPFTEARKRETAVVREPGGRLLGATKGATEVVLDMTDLDAPAREAWEQRILALAAEGQKVIACAWRELDGHGDDWTAERADGYRLAGIVALGDPVRDGVEDAIAACRHAGIHTIVVTGDHPVTARAVAARIGLGGGAPVVISGDELERLAAAGEGARLREVDVIARAAPAQKLGLVRALQDAGEVVAVTGDGVNDVPALQAADIGIAMGERGTRSAREVASIVLLDDNFRTVVRAVAEGRQLFHNLQLSFQYLLMIHIPLVVTAALVPLAGYPLLYLPVHIVWLEMLIHPTALLVFQELPADEGLAVRPRRRHVRFFSRREWTVIAAAGALVTVLVAGGYVQSVEETGNAAHGRAMALVTLSLASAALTAALSRLRTWTSRLLVALTVLSAVVLVQTPSLAGLLHLEPLHPVDWVVAAAGTLAAAAIPLVADRRRRRPGPQE
jgi:Ca2+-transporting ATPase